MKKLILPALVLTLAACSSAPERHRLFIDSNVSADVYTGDVKVGTTPYWGELSGNDVRHLTVRRRGYKTARIDARYGMKDGVMMGGVFAVSSSLISQCDKRAGSLFEEKETGVCGLSAMYTVGTMAYGVGVTALLADSFSAPSYVTRYDKNEYYVEMVPENKNAHSENDLRILRAKAFILKNFDALRSGDPEYDRALARLVRAPAAADKFASPAEYLRAVKP